VDVISKGSEWVNGEVTQGKMMVAIALILLVAIVFILKGDNTLLQGAVIPLSLLVLLLGGYGSFQMFKRPAHLVELNTLYSKSPEEAVQKELEKASKDSGSYEISRDLWSVLIIVSLVIGLIVSKKYYIGMSIGFAILFLTALTADAILKYRVDNYLESLKTLIKQL